MDRNPPPHSTPPPGQHPPSWIAPPLLRTAGGSTSRWYRIPLECFKLQCILVHYPKITWQGSTGTPCVGSAQGTFFGDVSLVKKEIGRFLDPCWSQTLFQFLLLQVIEPTIIFDREEINDGNGYKPATGIFKAPYKGTYLVYISAGKHYGCISRRQ